MTAVYVVRVVHPDGSEDVEILDAEPTDSFREELEESAANDHIREWSIRVGNINGGDSTLIANGAWSDL